jgi:pimeloyl-ACP methyl ester carboxylesterase
VVALARALLHLAASGGGEVARLAGEVHQAILLGPVALIPGVKALADRAPLPYRLVAASLDGLSRWVRPVAPLAASEELPWLRLMAVLDGVYGDKLAEQGSSLAMAMTLRTAAGRRMELAVSDRPTWVYVHGLCGVDTDWHSPAHAAFAAERAALGEASCYVRFNSGLAICDNGAALDALLQAQTKGPLILVGHSLGGLVLRSAMALAQTRQAALAPAEGSGGSQSWLAQVQRVALLGAPHAGAPLERAGHMLSQLLPMTPYTRPFERLAEIRSQAVRDLRYGAITPQQSAAIRAGEKQLATLVPLPPEPHYLVVAASLGEPRAGMPLGDGMVPVASAQGLHERPELVLTAPSLQRRVLTPLSHVGLVTDARVYALLRTDFVPVVQPVPADR